MITRLTDAHWCSACWHLEGWADCRLIGETVVVRVNGVERWRRQAGPMRWLHMAASQNGDVWVVASMEVAGADRAYLVTATESRTLGHPVYAMRGVRLTVENQGFVLYVCNQPKQWVRDQLEVGVVRYRLNAFADGTVAGMLGIQQGRPLWAEARSGGFVERDGLRFPQTLGRLTVGQIAGPDTIGVSVDGATPSVILSGQCYESELARRADGGYVVATRTATGCAFVLGPPWVEDRIERVEQPVIVPEFAAVSHAVGMAMIFPMPEET